MRLSRTIAYAVLSSLELAQAKPNCPIPCSELASGGNLPERFLLQILRNLVRHDIACSVRGAVGGYYLARAPEEITLLDIVEAFENPLGPAIPDIAGIPPHVHERVMAIVTNASTAARNELKKVTLAHLVDTLQ